MIRLLLLIGVVALGLVQPAAAGAPAPIPIKVVVLTTFEVGEDLGDRPGEFQFWAERYPLTHTLSVPASRGPVRYSDDGVLGVVTGMRGRARESVAALALSPQFDLSHAYWLVAGIAGVDPRAGSIGSAAWIDWVVDGDPLFELDDRELAGRLALRPLCPRRRPAGGEGLRRRLQRHGLAARPRPGRLGLSAHQGQPPCRTATTCAPTAPASPASPRRWRGRTCSWARPWARCASGNGERRTRWARDWIALWTDGRGVLAMTDCEDQGVMDVLALHARSGRVDLGRVLILRTASNYSREADGRDQGVKFAEGGAVAGFEAAWRVGAPVVRALVAGWPQYVTTPPRAGAR